MSKPATDGDVVFVFILSTAMLILVMIDSAWDSNRTRKRIEALEKEVAALNSRP